MGCLCSILSSTDVPHWQSKRAVEIKAATGRALAGAAVSQVTHVYIYTYIIYILQNHPLTNIHPQIHPTVLTQPHQDSLERLGAHKVGQNRMTRWNKGSRGHQRSTSWGHNILYLPHKLSWCEAKVRQVGKHSLAQRPRHPSSKWPAFDQACHFCQEGDPDTHSVSTSQCPCPWQRMMASSHAPSLTAK